MELKLEKVMKCYEKTVKLMEKISINEKISADDRNVIDIACNNVNGVKRELRRMISTAKKRKEYDYDSIINDYRLLAEKELSEICDKVSSFTIKEACLQQISQFKTDKQHSTADDDEDDNDDDFLDDDIDDQLNINPYINKNSLRMKMRRLSKRKTKIPPPDENDILKHRAELNVIETLSRLAKLEALDYDETIQLMEEVLKTHKNILTDDEICFITAAYQWITLVRINVDGCFSYGRGIKLADGILLIKRYRSDVEYKLQKVCKWMPNVMIKDIFLQHLAEFKKGPKPRKEPLATPYTRNPSHIKELTIREKKEREDMIAKEKEQTYGLHDHSKCIEEQEERYYPRFVHLGNWDSISEGGIDLLNSPGRDSKKVKETFKAEYEQWREEFNIQDSSPEHTDEDH